LAAAHERYAAKRPLSAALADRARAVIPGGTSRAVIDIAPFPFRVAQAAGAHLVDVDGHDYLDLLGDFTAGLLGHSPEPVAAAVRDRLERGWSLGATHEDELRLAELITSRFPAIDQLRFTNSGTEATIMAVQLARYVTGRGGVVVADGGYHGGLLNFSGHGEPLQGPLPIAQVPYGDLDAVATALAADPRPACVLLEPMLGAGGCLPPPDGYLAGVRELCDRHGVLFVLDEVMTSRMSTGGAQKRLGLTPDLTTLGKYLGGGLGFGAFGGRADLMAAFDPGRGGEVMHGGTFNNNALSMAAGVAAVGMLDSHVLDALFDRGEQLRARLVKATEATGAPFSVTGWGSLIGLHARPGPVRTAADVRAADPDLAQLLFHELLDRGFYYAPRGFVALSLPLTDADLDGFASAYDDVLRAVIA
jgi:glutamate-1-semialdehyde 2,1-aminomutase